MKISGGCYCGELRYEVEGEPVMAFQCHCRECQYYSGGGANYSLGMPMAGLQYTNGNPREFTRTDLETPATRVFCGTCGTAIASYYPGPPHAVFLKVGSFDDPGIFEPAMAVFTCDKQSFHHIPDKLPAFDKVPTEN